MPKGFFTKKETESISAVGGKIHSCASCGLYKDCQSPKMKPYGGFEKEIMCIGEAPGQVEDERGKPWQGEAGRLLRRALDKLGINLYRDCVSLNAVNCRPPENREPTINEIDHCRSIIVWKAIKKYMPKVILVFGGPALQSLVGHRWSNSLAISKWRGFRIPDQQLKTWICPTFHPSYLNRMDRPKDVMKIWMDDIEKALEKQPVKFPRYKTPEIEYVTDLSFLNDYPPILSAFDYETTGIKPQAGGHRIVTCSIADSEDHAWAFKMPKTKKGRLPLRKWLANPDIPKMAHNMKFENTWSYEILKVPVRGWQWDSMIAAHVIDNREGITSLNFQLYANFGILPYNQEVDRYLKSKNENEVGKNSKNQIRKLLKSKSTTKDLLKYNALDSAYEYKLATKQMEQLNWDFLPF